MKIHQTDRQRRKAAKKMMGESPEFRPLDLSEARFVPPGMTRAFQNNLYTVMVYDNTMTTAGLCTKALIQKHNNTPLINHWSEMQRIKNAIFGPEAEAVEYYPKESEKIDDYNIYWLWVFPEGVLPKMIK